MTIRAGITALEAVVAVDSGESRVEGFRATFRSRQPRPGSYFPIDWTLRTVEEFNTSMRRLATYCVRSRDRLDRGRREAEVRLYEAHLCEALARFRIAASARPPAHPSGEDAATREARKNLLDLIMAALEPASRNHFSVPSLSVDDLPLDRRGTLSEGGHRRQAWQAIIAASSLVALAVLFNWADVSDEFVSPVLIALGGAVTVLLPFARWPR
jgi:hypothetical protein